MGLKQGLEQVVEAARLAAERDEPVRFVLAGDGSQAEALRAMGAGLPTLEFLPVQPDGLHASLLAAADVLLLSERATQLDMSLPSKLTGYFAAGRPIVAAIPAGGASAREMRALGRRPHGPGRERRRDPGRPRLAAGGTRDRGPPGGGRPGLRRRPPLRRRLPRPRDRLRRGDRGVTGR